ncbi:MAG TPA: biopolymer transporter ExbD [Flavobacterium sp.]|mgnify:FL=1|jgi:biopolymer transport protein ExbD|uniref:ExbD/TolR family protein n=1 Tax=Flavobacterium sp. TaxID=239 RepID=UPI002CC99800|nr:biopolymer transporter ExbD [Flavobacterium sp.]MCA0349915.1 biopolymer transporter ExbD [Bacteroidota bacterium]HPW98381.1 biopolymer transporter ExbD [Flavobacterium sp.]HQA73980.1 biopolymer transporter ExbD [Flavobacterium sp.]
MAELNTGDGGGKKGGGKVRSKKSNSKVDLTAMVDLAFLLITFFMLTTSLSKPQSMDLGLPDKDEKVDTNIKVDQVRTMTIILGENNKIKWYHGLLESPEPNGKPTDATYGKDGIRKEILKRVKSIPIATGNPKKGMIVIIKPTKKSTYRNLVDILDEMAIANVPTYAIVNDITPEEMKLVDEMNK